MQKCNECLYACNKEEYKKMKNKAAYWAELLDGRVYGEELTKEEAKEAAENGIVIVYGASDDLMEFEGAIYEEVGVYGGETVYIDKKGIFEECECKYAKAAKEKCQKIIAIWSPNDEKLSWAYKTEIPHETFIIMDNYIKSQPYYRGIVFEMAVLEHEEKD